MAQGVFELATYPVHLGLGATAIVQEAFTGDAAWYEGRLVTVHTFHAPWASWEMHPEGDELVVCIAGRMMLHQEGGVVSLTLAPGQAAVSPPGVWHTADTEGEVSALFITAGVGTEHRPR
jgi:mannose-6-phosphate isomerase-like protein (cupin superfamily)